MAAVTGVHGIVAFFVAFLRFLNVFFLIVVVIWFGFIGYFCLVVCFHFSFVFFLVMLPLLRDHLYLEA